VSGSEPLEKRDKNVSPEGAAVPWLLQWEVTMPQSLLEKVKAYIAGQAEHHASGSFKQEFIALLQRHGISYDERHLFE
jgi:hypothetical protein